MGYLYNVRMPYRFFTFFVACKFDIFSGIGVQDKCFLKRVVCMLGKGVIILWSYVSHFSSFRGVRTEIFSLLGPGNSLFSFEPLVGNLYFVSFYTIISCYNSCELYMYIFNTLVEGYYSSFACL